MNIGDIWYTLYNTYTNAIHDESICIQSDINAFPSKHVIDLYARNVLSCDTSNQKSHFTICHVTMSG